MVGKFLAMQTSISDAELLEMMRGGDEAAFVALYERKQGIIYRFALRMCGSEAIAEDVTQEVFMALMHDNGRYDAGRGSFSAYLFGIARNQVLRRIEKDSRLQPIEDENIDGAGPSVGLIAMNDPLREAAEREMIEAVREAVLSLPAHYREVVVLCDLQELSYVEAAEALNCAVGTVRSRLHRARAMLIDRLRASPRRRNGESFDDIVNCFV